MFECDYCNSMNDSDEVYFTCWNCSRVQWIPDGIRLYCEEHCCSLLEAEEFLDREDTVVSFLEGYG